MLSDIILDVKAYYKEQKECTWENSSLRGWLNKEFINRAFYDREKREINITEVMSANNREYRINGGNHTSDKIFLLSLSEVDEMQGGRKYGFLDEETRLVCSLLGRQLKK